MRPLTNLTDGISDEIISVFVREDRARISNLLLDPVKDDQSIAWSVKDCNEIFIGCAGSLERMRFMKTSLQSTSQDTQS